MLGNIVAGADPATGVDMQLAEVLGEFFHLGCVVGGAGGGGRKYLFPEEKLQVKYEETNTEPCGEVWRAGLGKLSAAGLRDARDEITDMGNAGRIDQQRRMALARHDE